MNLLDLFTEIETEDYQKLKSPEAKRLYLQAFFMKDFGAFVYLLGYRDLGEFHKNEIKRLGKMRLIGDKPIRNLWLWARGHFKTSIITVAHTLWLIVNNPNIRILMVSYTLDIAKKIFKEVREHFILNNDFRYFFREYCPKANKEGKIEFGSTEELTVSLRTRILKEPTLKCAGVGTNLTTLHFDWMKIDDLVTEFSVTNDTQIQASKDYYGSLRQLFDVPEIPREDIIGTIYHFNDLYSSVIQKSDEFSKSFIPARDKNGVVVFHERFSTEGLDKILNDPSVGVYIFNCQYLLNPIDPAKHKFKDAWIEYYDILPDGLAEHILCDPASTKKKTSDYTVIERWGIDKDGVTYLIDGIRDKLSSNERVDLFVSVAKQSKNLKSARYEVLGGRHGDLENIRIKFLENNLPIEAKETKATNASKRDRIEQRLVGQFFSHKVLLPRNMPKSYIWNGKNYDFVKEYLSEFRQFPFSEHDDILDCHSQLFDGSFLVRGTGNRIEKKDDDEFDWWRNKAIDAKKRNRTRHLFGEKKSFGVPSTVSYR